MGVPDRVHVMEHSGSFVLVDRPTRLNATLAGLGFTILLNLACLVWGAARLTAAVDTLRETTSRLEQTLQSNQHTLADVESRVRVLEDRSGRGGMP